MMAGHSYLEVVWKLKNRLMLTNMQLLADKSRSQPVSIRL